MREIKLKLIIEIVILSLLLILSSGCGKESKTSSESLSTSISKRDIKPIPNHKVKKIELGIADSFAVLAYTSIISAPTSTIIGKVGLMPGGRSLINLNLSTEVAGGSDDVYAGDDSGDQLNYLSIAKSDLISAYRDAVGRDTDKDKIESFGGKLGGRALPSGTYRWSSGVDINSDLTIEGSESDVFIFQIYGNLTVAPGVKILLNGGARAKNIFWQVSGRVLLDSFSSFKGTVISQMTFEMKNQAVLNGRAFVKNGKLILSQNSISRPGI
jgi:hypothetical protein